MKKTIKIYEDSYKDLPSRFSQKIHHDLNYILGKDIPGLTKIDVVYQNETSESSPSVFQTVIDRDQKLILEVKDD